MPCWHGAEYALRSYHTPVSLLLLTLLVLRVSACAGVSCPSCRSACISTVRAIGCDATAHARPAAPPGHKGPHSEVIVSVCVCVCCLSVCVTG